MYYWFSYGKALRRWEPLVQILRRGFVVRKRLVVGTELVLQNLFPGEDLVLEKAPGLDKAPGEAPVEALGLGEAPGLGKAPESVEAPGEAPAEALGLGKAPGLDKAPEPGELLLVKHARND